MRSSETGTGSRATNVHDDLTGEQRARLCIATELIDVSTTELDGWDLLRYAHWVDTGADPDRACPSLAEPDPVRGAPSSLVDRMWVPAVPAPAR